MLRCTVAECLYDGRKKDASHGELGRVRKADEGSHSSCPLSM